MLVEFHQATAEGRMGCYLGQLMRDIKKHLADDWADGGALALVDSQIARLHRLHRHRTWARYRDDAAPVLLDLGEFQLDLEEEFLRLFARPRGDGDLGWIVVYEVVVHDRGARGYQDVD